MTENTDMPCKWEVDERDSGNTRWCVTHDSAHLPARKAKRIPRNAVEFALYGFMEAVSAAHRYQEVYTCYGCGDTILDPDHSLTEGTKHYHNRDCLQLAEVRTDG